MKTFFPAVSFPTCMSFGLFVACIFLKSDSITVTLASAVVFLLLYLVDFQREERDVLDGKATSVMNQLKLTDAVADIGRLYERIAGLEKAVQSQPLSASMQGILSELARLEKKLEQLETNVNGLNLRLGMGELPKGIK